MLGYFTPHKQYVCFVLTELAELAKTRPDQIREYQDAICKMLILDLDPLESVIAPLYPPIGKMADVQMEIYRSFILMKHCEVPLNNWVQKRETPAQKPKHHGQTCGFNLQGRTTLFTATFTPSRAIFAENLCQSCR